MWQNRPLIFRTRLLAVAFVTAGWLLHADDQPASSDGYKTISVNANGKTVPIRVQEPSNPYKNVSSSGSTGKYDPQSINFGATSEMANTTFSFPSDSLSKSDPDFKNPDQSTFITRSYTEDPSSPTVPNLDAKPAFPSTGAYSRSAAEFDKSYPTSNADAGQNQTALVASATSTDQNRTAALGGPEKPEVFPSDSMANKQYLGPGAQHIPDGIIKEGTVLTHISDLPDRPLTIDEVRDLINHGFKPDTDVKPGEPSKPLNDPNYKPQPLRDTPQSDASSSTGDDDKNDPVPPPGTMAAPQPVPENSEPLPQP